MALALIGKLLARSGISEDFREELEGYKTDIAEGEFNEADHRYIRAVFKRADVLIANDGSMDRLRDTVGSLWESRVSANKESSD